MKRAIVETIVEQRKTIYHQPLPVKKQRVIARSKKHGPVKIYTQEEIELYMKEMNYNG